MKGEKKPGRRVKAADARRAADSRRAPYHHGDLRRALVEGGLALLAREGIAGFSLRSLAQELGVSHAAPYRHFSSREDLLAEIVAENNRGFVETLRASLAAPCPAGERVYLLGEAYVRFYLSKPEALALFDLLPSRLASAGEGFRAIFASHRSGAEEGGEPAFMQDEGFALLRAEVEALMPGFPGLSEREVLLGFWAKAHGLAALLVAQPDYFAPEELGAGLRKVLRRAF
jgi:AcrR family transcriptional regulator